MKQIFLQLNTAKKLRDVSLDISAFSCPYLFIYLFQWFYLGFQMLCSHSLANNALKPGTHWNNEKYSLIDIVLNYVEYYIFH